jgi:hypothetical protein
LSVHKELLVHVFNGHEPVNQETIPRQWVNRCCWMYERVHVTGRGTSAVGVPHGDESTLRFWFLLDDQITPQRAVDRTRTIIQMFRSAVFVRFCFLVISVCSSIEQFFRYERMESISVRSARSSFMDHCSSCSSCSSTCIVTTSCMVEISSGCRGSLLSSRAGAVSFNSDYAVLKVVVTFEGRR